MRTIFKNQIIKIITVFLFIYMGTFYMHGQFSQSMLINKEWVCRIPGKSYCSITSYTDKERIAKVFITNGVKADGEIKNAYYLSEGIVEKFQADSVGNSKSGKYIVTLRIPKIGEATFEQHEILELTESTLRIRHIRSSTILDYKVEEK